MTDPIDLTALHRILSAEVGPDALPVDVLERLPPLGLDNDHVRVRSARLLVRIPRRTQAGLTPVQSIALQADRFACAERSGHTPRLKAVLPPDHSLPAGALLIEEIVGRPASVPDDLPAIADALRALHGDAADKTRSGASIPRDDDPVNGLLALATRQRAFLPDAGASPETCALVDEEIEAACRFARQCADARPPVALIGVDTHPGNFIMAADGRAMFVDLDKIMIGSNAVDLAHATLPTSVFWATGDSELLPHQGRINFYERYLNGLSALQVTELRPWLAPMQRLTWLRTTTWAARWRVEHLPDLSRHSRLADLVRTAEERTRILLDAETIADGRNQLAGWNEEIAA